MIEVRPKVPLSSVLPWNPSKESLKYVIKLVELLILSMVMMVVMILRSRPIFFWPKLVISFAFFWVNESSIGVGYFFEDFLGTWVCVIEYLKFGFYRDGSEVQGCDMLF